MIFDPFSPEIWDRLVWPMLRLLMGLAAGLLVANLLECLNWTRGLCRLSLPLARAAHLSETSGAAFALAFVSPASANALLSQKHAQGELSFRELMLSNLFNSLPAYVTHTPTIFLLTWPVLGLPAVIYVGLTLLAALGRTAATIALSRRMLPPPAAAPCAGQPEGSPTASTSPRKTALWREAAQKAWLRFLKRLPRLVLFTVPVYVLMYALQVTGGFDAAKNWLAAHIAWLSIVPPQAMGIVALHLAAELGAALGAAGSLLATGGLGPQEVVLALLVGNILSTPMRALRHQLPAYAAFFAPALGLRLIAANQGLRAASMSVVALLYWLTVR
ncbi:MAG: hypothetical protein K6F46_01335 [Desulfovibrio sp.]|nr:hypothetical protein [Desulfovibrio sp.]